MGRRNAGAVDRIRDERTQGLVVRKIQFGPKQRGEAPQGLKGCFGGCFGGFYGGKLFAEAYCESGSGRCDVMAASARPHRLEGAMRLRKEQLRQRAAQGKDEKTQSQHVLYFADGEL